jgi:hypothetical protein
LGFKEFKNFLFFFDFRDVFSTFFPAYLQVLNPVFEPACIALLRHTGAGLDAGYAWFSNLGRWLC